MPNLILFFLTVAIVLFFSSKALALSIHPKKNNAQRFPGVFGFVFIDQKNVKNPREAYSVEKVELLINVDGQLANVVLRQMFKN
ncbi:MAG: hypothetical protein LBF22_00275, partial [Deltaproteobacteria bacterium]|nr:hypothetical protein [Deltaproteobacteria bacterium]